MGVLSSGFGAFFDPSRMVFHGLRLQLCLFVADQGLGGGREIGLQDGAPLEGVGALRCGSGPCDAIAGPYRGGGSAF